MKKIFITYSHQDESFVRHLIAELKDLDVTIWIDHAIFNSINWYEKIVEALQSGDCDILIFSVDYMSNATVSIVNWLSTNCAESYEDHNFSKAFFISIWHDFVKNKNQEATWNTLINTANTYDTEWITYLTLEKIKFLSLINHWNLYNRNEFWAAGSILRRIIIQRDQNLNLKEIKYAWLDESPFYWKRARKGSITLSWLSAIVLQAGLLPVTLNFILAINLIVSRSILRNKGDHVRP
jgi:hypothetical protein